MEWYYAVGGQQAGPVSDAQLQELQRAGTINASTLVWRTGLAEWVPLQRIRPDLASAAPASLAPMAPSASAPAPFGAPGATAVCAECQKVFAQGEMVFLNRSWVCANCKPLFVQRLREGAAPVGGQLWRYKRQLVLRPDTPLPDRCVKCNAPALGGRLKRKLYWHPSAVYLLLLLNLLIYAVVALIVRKGAVLHIGICEAHRKRRVVIITGSWVAVLVGIALFIYGLNISESAPAVLGVVLFLTAAIVGLVLGRQVGAAKIDKEFVWVTGVCKEYLADLPEWNGPS